MAWLRPSHSLLHHIQQQLGVLLHHVNHFPLILASKQLLELGGGLVHCYVLGVGRALVALAARDHQPQCAHRLVHGRFEAAQHRISVDARSGRIILVIYRQTFVQLHDVVRSSC